MTELYTTIRDSVDTPVSRFLTSLESVRTNPAGIQRVMLAQVRDVLNGEIALVDATNPYVNLMEATAVNTASFVIENETTTRQQYPSTAQTIDDLYLHMSDKDYIDRFAVPAKATFRMMVSKEELLGRMVVDVATGIGKVVIPRFSTIEVGDHVFTLLYPIEIKQLQHGGLQVVYDADQPSPLQVLTTNEVKWTTRTPTKEVSLDRVVMISIDFEVLQLRVSSVNSDINQATGYNKVMAFKDEYCYAKVFYKNNATGGLWREIKTTHTEQVYDISTPTALLQVGNGALTVRIPQIYLTQGVITGSLRVDVYTSKGAVQLNTSVYKASAFSCNWAVIDSSEKTPYVAAWQAMRTYFVYSTDVVSGGAAPLGFEALRDRVIMNTVGGRVIPITGAQNQASLTRTGFEIVKHTDILTERRFLATRTLPKPFDAKLVTAGSASIESVILSFEEAINHGGTLNHGERVTLTPSILYENTNGVVRMVTESAYATLMSYIPERRALAVSNGNYLYTPFHYVLDAGNDMFDARAYYLDAPTIETAMFIDQNDTTGLQVTTGNVSITKYSGGYRVLVKTSSNNAWRDLDASQLHAQLSYLASGEDAKCYLNGTLVGRSEDGETFFEFAITSSFDVDALDRLYLNSFKILNLENRSVPALLEQLFELTYATSSLMPAGWLSHQMDNQLGRFLLPNRIAGVTQERISIQFGKALNNLWSSARSIPSSAPYRTYDADVQAFYEKDVLAVDPATGTSFSVKADGTLDYTYLARQGDPILDNSGGPVYLHRKGDVMLDTNHNPIPVGESYLSRQVDLFFIEGVYHFADDYSTTTYRSEMVATVVNWITKDLASMTGDLLEQTEIFFYPKTSMGSVKALIEGGNVTQVQAGQALTVRLYVGDSVFDNADLRTTLSTAAVEVIDSHFKQSTVSVSAITDELRKRYASDVVGISISGLGGSRNLEIITMLVESERCSIRKKLVALPNGQLIVREDVTVDFVRHSQTPV